MAWVTGAGVGAGGGGGAGAVVVVTGGEGAAGAVTVGAALVVVTGLATVLVDVPELERAGAGLGDDCVDVVGGAAPVAFARATAAAAWAVAAAIEALMDAEIDDAVELAFCAVEVNAATMRRSLAKVALRRASFCALRAL